MTVDNILRTSEDVDRFIRSLGFRLCHEAIAKVISVLQGETGEFSSLFALYKEKRLPSGDRTIPLCGKGTAYKIKRMLNDGLLRPYVEWLEDEKDSPNKTQLHRSQSTVQERGHRCDRNETNHREMKSDSLKEWITANLNQAAQSVEAYCEQLSIEIRMSELWANGGGAATVPRHEYGLAQRSFIESVLVKDERFRQLPERFRSFIEVEDWPSAREVASEICSLLENWITPV